MILINAHRFHSKLFPEGVTPPDHSVTPHHPIVKSVNSHPSILERKVALRSEIVDQISLLERSVTSHERRIRQAQPVVQTLLKVAKVDPACAAHTLLGEGGELVAQKPRQQLRCSSGKNCRSVTLPYSRYCLERKW